jgi:Ni,Fe-hydrogenase maturation factor
MVKIVCLGNEFIEGDCLAKEVGELLKDNFDIINVRDSFELMEIVSSGEQFVLLDVVEKLDKVMELEVKDLRGNSIVSAHDFDATYVLKLMDSDVRIIGIPQSSNAEQIASSVEHKILLID